MIEKNVIQHILVVDDFKASALFVQSILETKGYTVSIVHSGNDALNFIVSNSIDLILLDIILPGIDGYEICRQIRRQQQFDEIPIVFMTSKEDEQSIVRGFEVGAQDYLKKPFLKYELLARIKTQLTLRKQRLELEQINKKLEKRVTEKTQKLDEAFLELQRAYKKIEDVNVKLKVLDQAKLDFLLIISHEIRTPLNSILGFSEILQDFEGSDDYKSSVNLLLNSARRLEDFSQNAILISELQLGKYIYMFSQIKLILLLNTVIEKLREKNIEIYTKVQLLFNENLIIYGDGNLLNVCFFNIIENALRYVDEKGKIEVTAWDEGDEIIVEITDEGKHFSDSTLAEPFSLFSKGEKFINNNPGNGLSIIKLVMDSHKGHIELFNTTQGACIRLYFPHYRDGIKSNE